LARSAICAWRQRLQIKIHDQDVVGRFQRRACLRAAVGRWRRWRSRRAQLRLAWRRLAVRVKIQDFAAFDTTRRLAVEALHMQGAAWAAARALALCMRIWRARSQAAVWAARFTRAREEKLASRLLQAWAQICSRKLALHDRAAVLAHRAAAGRQAAAWAAWRAALRRKRDDDREAVRAAILLSRAHLRRALRTWRDLATLHCLARPQLRRARQTRLVCA
jgi:hypothetical protein